ncbi:MAG: rRNA maturation RNase YbeY [Candidatus Moranbacteria bacterium]|nr:rRNA maturation RNase YbeY [Candidatus Moranbacteria bacterium]
MKIILEINDLAKSPILKSLLNIIAEKTLKEADFSLKNKIISLEITLVSPPEIKKLNRRYRKINKVTDVLSFSEYKNTWEIEKDSAKNLFLGELILCYNEIKEYAQKQAIPVRQELVGVTAHGILHLLGMKHGKKMFRIQTKVINKIIKIK